ncbi:uncharacterized protein LOC117643633 isoform X2 [Thrips palmi]|uniref:Uncharacterized protein LOC117643633 isoform X2 n=1 Tax=Thrips palmi TaxID=161013 RepID=A0A6P8YWF6_THRPL|nr:uncharacterized protein LOC117643633 isoform X2 [Thrips palmi]
MCFDTDITGSDPLGQGLIWPFSSWGATSSDILTIAMHTKVDKSLLRFLETRMNEELSKQTLQVRAPVVIRIHRCIGTISENTCEYFNSFIWTTAVCQFLKAKGVFWTPMKEALHPTFECPIKKKVYNARKTEHGGISKVRLFLMDPMSVFSSGEAARGGVAPQCHGGISTRSLLGGSSTAWCGLRYKYA